MASLLLAPSPQLPIAAPPWSKLGKRLESLCRKAIFDFKLMEGVTKVGIALSGGKDSLSLLFLLKAISGRGFPSWDLHAFHISGEFSCGAGVQLNYLKAICNQLEVPFTIRESTQKLETLECYSCSRERRRLLFEAAKNEGIHTLAFGHHQDDHAQTVLMNLLHKGEFAGLLPKLYLNDYDVTIIRPLCYHAEKDLRHFAQQHGFNRITCRCPVGQHSMRKKTDQMIDEISALFPNARENIARAGRLYGSEKARRQ